MFKMLPTTHSCFVCGQNNPSGLRLRFETDGSLVRTRFLPSEAVIGFPGVVHGGILSTVLDEVMVWACGVQTQRFAYCAEINVRFLAPARPGDELTGIGRLVENRRNRIFRATGEIRSATDQLLASASGKYSPIPEADSAALLAEFDESGAEFLKKFFSNCRHTSRDAGSSAPVCPPQEETAHQLE